MRDRDRVEPLGRAFEVGVGVGGEMLSRKAVSERIFTARSQEAGRPARTTRRRAAAPLADGAASLLDHPVVESVAAEAGRTPAQVS